MYLIYANLKIRSLKCLLLHSSSNQSHHLKYKIRDLLSTWLAGWLSCKLASNSLETNEENDAEESHPTAMAQEYTRRMAVQNLAEILAMQLLAA
jgi:hypothetical protein